MKMKAFSTALVLLVLASVPAVFAVNVDGTIASGEYSKQAVFDKGNFKLLWEFEGDKVFMAIVAKTPGWVAIGFNPSTVMAKSDMVLGLVKDQS
ncbi:MAG: DOMON domain-containing protein, partial [Rectinema sp.]